MKGKRFLNQLLIFTILTPLVLLFSGPVQAQSANHFDVIVVGGEPEGVVAAVAAARNGAKTLLIEKRDGLGGLMTYGMLNYLDVSMDMYGEYANAGIFHEWHQMVGGGIAFDVNEAKQAFLTLVNNEPNLTLSLQTTLKDVIMDDNTLVGIRVEKGGQPLTFYAKRFIDSTQDADLAAMAGVPYFIGGQDIGIADTKMAATLMIHLKNVRWDGIDEAVKTKKFGESYIQNNVAWGFGELRTKYKPVEPDVRLRGLNIARQKDGTVYINALQIFGVDGLDEASKLTAIERGKRETKHIVDYLRAHIPGFEQAEIASYPPELYVRETRHIQALYQLSIVDVWENRDQWDSVGLGSYPVDVQATSVDDPGIVLVNPTQYAIPFRSLVPKDVEHLLVASRASGYSSLAAGSARVLPIGMTAGQAAGTAAALSIRADVDFVQMSQDKALITALQGLLKAQGARLYDFVLPYPYENEWFYPSIRKVLEYGLLKGGYDNDIKPFEPMEEKLFIEILSKAICRASQNGCTESLNVLPIDDNLTRDRAAEIILKLMDAEENADNAWTDVMAKGWVDPTILVRMLDNRVLQRAEAYHMIAWLIEIVEQQKDL